MKKITDRFWLGIIAGIGGNLAKNTVEGIFTRKGLLKSTAKQKAAGIFVRKADINTPQGKLLGAVADNMIAAGLGITCIYWLTLMGKDKYFIKGAGLGAAEWTTLYGVMSKIGATAIYPIKPREALISLLSHFAFGATKMAIAVNLGDSRLFKPGNLTLEIDNPEKLNLLDKNQSNPLHQ
ncbi:MAG: hypothetical protein VR69_09975 [Peptococcaceae bacterium BRH_c4b]|nr:MAG: hypothetical protein VR69_09975 [Peptococcaceae bacterium BRH_c4b]